MNCLLIRTKDNRKFLTHQCNLQSLIEFSKVFSAEIYLVKHKEGKLLELKSLAQSLCKQDCQDVDVTIIKKLFPKSGKSRKDILKNSQKIQSFIEKRLISGKPLSLKDLKDKYKDLNITDACLCNHFATVRKNMSKSGHVFRKMGAGRYCLSEHYAC